jgi:hypothetical protein
MSTLGLRRSLVDEIPLHVQDGLDVGIDQMRMVGLRHLGVLNRLLHGAERGN